MKAESVRDLKDEISGEEIASHGYSPEIASFFAATEPPMPIRVALGIAVRADGEHVLAIRTDSPRLADELAKRAKGEADIRILTVDARVSVAQLQDSVRPLEPGAQVQIRGTSFVGTLGAFVRDNAGVLYALSNSHVLADVGATPIGTVIGQPFGAQPIGVLARHVPLSRVSPNLVDAAIARLDRTEALVDGWNAALPGRLRGAREITEADLGRSVVKVGRTTGVRLGKITAVEVDGMRVNYSSAGLITFNDSVEVSGGPAVDFSAPGDSGSLILDTDGWAVALLFAGGNDGTEDVTYGNRIGNVLSALGVALAV